MLLLFSICEKNWFSSIKRTSHGWSFYGGPGRTRLNLYPSVSASLGIVLVDLEQCCRLDRFAVVISHVSRSMNMEAESGVRLCFLLLFFFNSFSFDPERYGSVVRMVYCVLKKPQNPRQRKIVCSDFPSSLRRLAASVIPDRWAVLSMLFYFAQKRTSLAVPPINSFSFLTGSLLRWRAWQRRQSSPFEAVACRPSCFPILWQFPYWMYYIFFVSNKQCKDYVSIIAETKPVMFSMKSRY